MPPPHQAQPTQQEFPRFSLGVRRIDNGRAPTRPPLCSTQPRKPCSRPAISDC